MSNKAFRVSEEWLEKVDKVVDKPEKVTTGRTPTSSRFYDVRPVRQRSSSWTYENGEYSAEFAPLINNKPDNTNVIRVYAPTASAAPITGIGAKYFAAWRGRWEIVDVGPRSIPTVTVSEGLSVGQTSTTISITNTGTIGAKIWQDASYTDYGVLNFSPTFFAWDNSWDVVGKRMVGLKTHTERVVTDVTLEDGQLSVSYKDITAIG